MILVWLKSIFALKYHTHTDLIPYSRLNNPEFVRLDYNNLINKPAPVDVGRSLVPILQTTATGATFVEFSNLTAYDNYVIDLHHVRPTNDAVQMFMQISDDNGATYKTTGYHRSINGRTSQVGGGAAVVQGTNESSFQMHANVNIGNDANRGLYGHLLLMDVRSAAAEKLFRGWTVNINKDDLQVTSYLGGGRLAQTAAYNAAKFYFTSGTYAAGTFRLYGVDNGF